MPLFHRRDSLLLAGLAVALVVIFAAPLVQVLELAREVERQSGLALVSGLVLLTGVFAVHQLQKRHEMQAQAVAGQVALQQAEARAQELERLVTFGHALTRSLDYEAIKSAVEQYLPRVAGTDAIWVLLRKGTSWEPLAGDARGAGDAIDREDFAERVLCGVSDVSPTERVAFPLVAGGTALGVVGVNRDTSGQERPGTVEAAAAILAVSLKNAQLFHEVRENSLRDSTTGCATRAHATEVIDAELRRARRNKLPMSLIMIDLDHFNEVNARYGQPCGDAVLANVGRRMRDVLRGSDLKCRYGGEEFLVLLPDTPLQGARRVAETLRREIGERPIPWAGDAVTVTASLGLTQALPGEIDVHSVIARADVALCRAKEEGRNCVRVASAPPSFLH